MLKGCLQQAALWCTLIGITDEGWKSTGERIKAFRD